MTKQIKNIIFDFGNVLVEFNPHKLYDDVFNGDAAKAEWFHQNITTEPFYNRIDRGDNFEQCISDLQKEHPEYAKEIALYDSRYHDMVGDALHGMPALLTNLKVRGYHLYGLTNWSYKVYAVMERVPLFRVLDGSVVSSEEHMIKPDERIYQRIVSKFGLTPSECLFVDDRQININAALACGMHAILFKNSEQLSLEMKSIGIL
jgi:epoxide hydrolase-like predicted phosphatase